MPYLSYPDKSGLPVASAVIDQHSTFAQTGAFFSLDALPIGYHCTIFGVAHPHGRIAFDRRPVLRGTEFPPNLGDVGKIVPQADGTVAIEWPL